MSKIISLRLGAWRKVGARHTDEEIVSIARKDGVDVPFVRPAELTDDHTGITPVIAHAIEWYLKHDFDPIEICCIYAKAPVMPSEDIELGHIILDHSDVDFAFAVTTCAFRIQRTVKLRVDGSFEMFDPFQFQARLQDLTEAFNDAGQFYWGSRDAWLSGKPIFGPKSAPVLLP